VKRWQASVVLLFALAQTCGVVYWVLTANLSAKAYPVNADSIGLPLVEGMIHSALLLCLSLGANGVLCSPGASISVYRKVAFVLLAMLAVCLAAMLILYWAVPNHFAIAWSYALFMGAMFTVGVVRWRKNSA
jgi:hypothetical protein